MKALKIITVLGMAVLVAAVQPSEAGVRKSGLTGAAFLKIGVGARAVALGSAYTTITGDVNQMFWNPAGTALKGGKSQVMLSHNSWIADISHDTVGYSRDMGNLGTLGIGIVTMGLSDIAADRDAVPCGNTLLRPRAFLFLRPIAQHAPRRLPLHLFYPSWFWPPFRQRQRPRTRPRRQPQTRLLFLSPSRKPHRSALSAQRRQRRYRHSRDALSHAHAGRPTGCSTGARAG